MRIRLKVRGERGQFFNERREPLGPEFPAFTSIDAGHLQLMEMWRHHWLKDWEVDELDTRLVKRWGTYSLPERVRRLRDNVFDALAIEPILLGLAVGSFLIQLAWHEKRSRAQKEEGV